MAAGAAGVGAAGGAWGAVAGGAEAEGDGLGGAVDGSGAVLVVGTIEGLIVSAGALLGAGSSAVCGDEHAVRSRAKPRSGASCFLIVPPCWSKLP